MADYPVLAPTLAALNTTKNDPQGSEAASKLDDAIRQTRVWLYDFLSQYIDVTNNKLKSNAFITGSLPSGVIRGTNPVDRSQREIAQGTVNTEDLADRAVTGQKIAVGGVTASNLAPGSITSDKLNDGSITLAKLATGMISTNQIADASITTPKLIDGAVVATKVSDNAILTRHLNNHVVSANKLETAGVGFVMVGGNGESENEYKSVELSGAVRVDKDGIVTFASLLEAGALGFTHVAEVASPGIDGAPAASGSTLPLKTWLPRGTTPGNIWRVLSESRKLVEMQGPNIYFIEDGNYLIMAGAPGYGCNNHKARLIIYPDGAIITPQGFRTFVGTTEATAASVQTTSTVVALVTMSTTGDERLQRPLLRLEHWVAAYPSSGSRNTWGTSSATSSSGGTSADSSLDEAYAYVTIIKLS